MFSWLGSRRAIQWVFDRLSEVRGVDRVVCVTTPELAKAVDGILSDDVSVFSTPAGVSSSAGEMLGWACSDGPAKDYNSALMVSASAPFLSSGRMEECLELVRSGKSVTARPVRTIRVIDRHGDGCDSASATAIQPAGLVALRPEKFAGSCDDWPKDFVGVEVGFIESIDVKDDEQLAVAQAVADNGVV